MIKKFDSVAPIWLDEKMSPKVNGDDIKYEEKMELVPATIQINDIGN